MKDDYRTGGIERTNYAYWDASITTFLARFVYRTVAFIRATIAELYKSAVVRPHYWRPVIIGSRWPICARHVSKLTNDALVVIVTPVYLEILSETIEPVPSVE